MSLQSHVGEYAAAVTKASPPLAVTGATALGVSLQDWVLIATLVYTVLQIGVLLHGLAKKRATARIAEVRDGTAE